MKILEVGIGTGVVGVGFETGEENRERREERKEGRVSKGEARKEETAKVSSRLTRLNLISFLRPDRPLYSSSEDLSALHSE